MKKEPTIIFEDQDILVVNKPGGMVTNRAKSVVGETMQDWFIDHQQGQSFPDDWQQLVPADFSPEYGTPEEIYEQRQGMVHRLDKDTSGVIVFAKHPGSLVNLLAQFRDRKVQKEYLALVHGQFRVAEGTITAPLARSRTDRQKFAVDIEGRKAVTEYEVIETFKGFKETGELDEEVMRNQRLYEQGFSLVRCLPKTGRTHQIRVHLAHEQHPLVGDTKYVGKKRAKVDPLWCSRQFLHAAVLEFSHPRTDKRERFEGELGEELGEVVVVLAQIIK